MRTTKPVIGKMNKKITLQQPVNIPDGRGGYKKTYETVTSVWAEFLTPNVSTEEANGTIISEVMRKVSIWRRNDVKKGWRVLWGNRILSIEHTYEYGDALTTLVCKEVVK